jgi:hypothetical protein
MELEAMGKQQREQVLLYAASEGNLRLLKSNPAAPYFSPRV